MAKEILEGIRVLDQSRWQLGPVAAMMLAQMGAEVIKIEEPFGDIGRSLPIPLAGGQGKGRFGENLSAYFEHNNRLKKSITLDMSKPRAKEVLYKLVEKSDVYLQNLRHGVPEKLGCDYETLKKINPRLIYCACSSFGTKGPDGEKPGFDPSGMSRSGAMYTTPNEKGEPVTTMGGAYDQIGAIFASYGVLGALMARERHGIGQYVETSHLTASMWLLGLLIGLEYYARIPGMMKATLRPREEATNQVTNYYRCADGKWIELCMMVGDRHWPVVCAALGIAESEWKDDPGLNSAIARTKAENARRAVALLDKAFAKKTQDEVIKAFKGKDIFWEKVQEFKDLATDAQVIANEYMTDYTHPITGVTYKYQHLPMDFAATSAKKVGRAPLLGEHNEEVLIDILGYKKAEVPKIIEEMGAPQAYTGATLEIRTGD